MLAKLEVSHLSKEYPGVDRRGIITALSDVTLTVDTGEFVSLLGPSGCGKSTLLHIIAGFEEATSGAVRMDGRELHGPGADRGMVFQDYALFPWKTLIQNVMFGLKIRGLEIKRAREIAREYIALVGLTGFEDRFPHELSGGMRQRCALARSVANSPEVLLLDEPLAAIDALTRNALQEEILKVCAARADRPKTTAIYVTHSIEEAVFLSDRIVVMTPRPGRILEVLKVPFGASRNDDIRRLPEFQALVGQIWDHLKSHVTV